MKALVSCSAATLAAAAFIVASCSTQSEKAAPMTAAPTAAPAPAASRAAPAAEAKAPTEKAEKAKATKVSGDVGLLDLEKNYMILVTKQGKLITLDFDPKTKATALTPAPAKMTDIGLGSSATVTYEKMANKNVAKSVEFKAKKGGE